jgi:hypothetical protein
MTVKATLRQGVIVPLEPVPTDWTEGTRLEIGLAIDGQQTPALNIDEWAKEMASLCSDSNADDEARMRRAIEEHREQAKNQTRREMGLTG